MASPMLQYVPKCGNFEGPGSVDDPRLLFHLQSVFKFLDNRESTRSLCRAEADRLVLDITHNTSEF